MHTTQRKPFPLVEAAQTTLPHIAKLAQQYLSTPESSAYSERFFRRLSSYIFEDKRSKLLLRDGKKFLFLHYNLGRL